MTPIKVQRLLRRKTTLPHCPYLMSKKGRPSLKKKATDLPRRALQETASLPLFSVPVHPNAGAFLLSTAIASGYHMHLSARKGRAGGSPAAERRESIIGSLFRVP